MLPNMKRTPDAQNLLAICYQLSWQDDREREWDLYTATLDRRYQVTHIQYDYDPLYRLVSADYSGDFNGEYTYAHDAVGNRTAYTTTITSTAVITYHYDTMPPTGCWKAWNWVGTPPPMSGTMPGG